jgi:hypothetical protein
MNIRYVAGEQLLDPNRVNYTQMNVDVEVSSTLELSNTRTGSLNSHSDQDT